jgi:general secretion pathway protein G
VIVVSRRSPSTVYVRTKLPVAAAGEPPRAVKMAVAARLQGQLVEGRGDRAARFSSFRPSEAWRVHCSTADMRGRASLRRHHRGVTLLEVLVVVAIMSLIAAAVGVGAYKHWQHARLEAAAHGARTIRAAVQSSWIVTGTGDCPTVARLVAHGALDADSPQTDPWGKAWRIECSGDEVSVSSDGPDRIHRTEDDVRVPPLGRGRAAEAPEDSS